MQKLLLTSAIAVLALVACDKPASDTSMDDTSKSHAEDQHKPDTKAATKDMESRVKGDAPATDDAAAEPTSQTPYADSLAKTDKFVWLEEVQGDKALEFVEEQNTRSLSELKADPRYAPMHDEALAILNSDERIVGASFRGGYAYNFWQDETNVRGLWRRMPIADYVAGKGKADTWEVLLDVDALATKEDKNWVYKGTDCLYPDYTKCLITLSPGGSDASHEREFDLATKSFIDDGFNLPEAKSGTAWIDADTMLVGTDFGDLDGVKSVTDSGYPRTVRVWQRGQDVSEATEVFAGETADVGIWPFTTHYKDKDGAEQVMVGIVRSKTFFEQEYYMQDADGNFNKMDLPLMLDMNGILNGQLMITLNQDWDYDGSSFKSGQVIAVDLADKSVKTVFTPADRMSVQGVSNYADGLLISVLDNIEGKLLRITPNGDGFTQEYIDLPENGVVSLSALDHESGDMLVYYENPTTPETQFFVKGGETSIAPLQESPAYFDASDMVTIKHEAVSTDGTKIPYFVTGKKSVLEAGPAPTVQYGYGGFQISILPTYSALNGKLWMERGGVYVTANIRGGGEFGPAWHQAGLKGKRQIIYDDFFAVSEDMIEKGITTPDQLGILGGSNGGLLMGVSMTQRPDLYNAVGIGVPLLDMLRYHTLLAGASWVGEYGNPEDEDERAFLETISPYQNLDKDADYPRAYIFTSTKDDRVHPGHARKFAAMMGDMGHDYLYYENTEGGHAAASNKLQSAQRYGLQYVYFFKQLADEK